MTIEEKIENFLLSQEVEEIAKEVIGIALLEINPFNLGIGLALLDLITENRPKESELKDFIKNFFEKNNIEIPEVKINQIYEYLKQNFLPKVFELYKEEVEIPEIKEEPFEEKEKKYLEIMESIVKKPEVYEEEKKKIVVEPEIEKPKTLTIGFEEKKEESLPEGTVIIRRKDEEEKKEESEVLDLSNL